ncbi:MAG: hypothetical protein AAGJ31_01975, partial [Verrucomicrobiota bacterium]
SLPSKTEHPRSHDWQATKAMAAQTASNQSLELSKDGTFLLRKNHAPNDTITASVELASTNLAAIRLRVLPHPALPKSGPGTAGNGNFVLTRFEAFLNGKALSLASAQADHEQPHYPIAATLDDNPETGWAINSSRATPGVAMNAPHEGLFALEKAVSCKPGDRLEIRLHHERNANYHVGHFAIDTSVDPLSPPNLRTLEDRALANALDIPRGERNKEQLRLIEQSFFAAHPDLAKKEEGAKLMIMEDLAAPRDTFLLTRGDFTRPDKELGLLFPGALSSVSPALPAKEGRNRLELAKR